MILYGKLKYYKKVDPLMKGRGVGSFLYPKIKTPTSLLNISMEFHLFLLTIWWVLLVGTHLRIVRIGVLKI